MNTLRALLDHRHDAYTVADTVPKFQRGVVVDAAAPPLVIPSCILSIM